MLSLRLPFRTLLAAALSSGVAAANPPLPSNGLLFTEGFDDSRLAQRGWYDGNRYDLSPVKPQAGAANIAGM